VVSYRKSILRNITEVVLKILSYLEGIVPYLRLVYYIITNSRIIREDVLEVSSLIEDIEENMMRVRSTDSDGKEVITRREQGEILEITLAKSTAVGGIVSRYIKEVPSLLKRGEG
jgi:hypothetical protein